MPRPAKPKGSWDHASPPTMASLQPPEFLQKKNAYGVCADSSSTHKVNLKISGLCGQCYTRTDEVSLNNIRMLACNSEYIYKIDSPTGRLSDDWVEMTAAVINILKNGSVAVGEYIQMVTPRSCTCPYRSGFSSPHFLFGSQVDIFVDNSNRKRKMHVVDHTTTFVSATSNYNSDPNRIASFINIALQACGN